MFCYALKFLFTGKQAITDSMRILEKLWHPTSHSENCILPAIRWQQVLYLDHAYSHREPEFVTQMKKKPYLAQQCLGRGAFFATTVYSILVISHSDTLIRNLDLMLLSFLFCDKCK